jgi:hypothetical protein
MKQTTRRVLPRDPSRVGEPDITALLAGLRRYAIAAVRLGSDRQGEPDVELAARWGQDSLQRITAMETALAQLMSSKVTRGTTDNTSQYSHRGRLD